MTRSSYCLVMMSKAPVSGKVKTRLIPTLGARRAASIYQQLLMASCENISSPGKIDQYLSCAPNIQHHSFLNIARQYSYRRHQQPMGDLGKRMSATFSSLLRRYTGVILIGADCPVIDKGIVEQCRSYLEEGADVVLGATDDGGYALIGMQRQHSALFRNMPWSSARVADITRQRAKACGLKMQEIGGLWDVDTPADVRRWQRHRRQTLLN